MANDPYWNNVVLAMHMDGPGLTDLKGHTVTLNGNVARSATQSKFGGYSAYFDGTGDYLSLGDSDDWFFGASDWTIEAWVFRTSTGVTSRILAQRASSDAANLLTFGIANDETLRIAVVSGGTTITNLKTSGAIPANTWAHVAVTRANGHVKLFVNGVNNDVVTTNATTDYPNLSFPLIIGRGYSNLDSETFYGYIDDLRITKGVARYTADFTVPTEAFPNTPPQLLGTVRDMNSNLVARTVRSYRRSDGMLAGTTVSSGVDGTFSVNAYDGSAHYVVCLDDGAPDENALILDNITPV